MSCRISQQDVRAADDLHHFVGIFAFLAEMAADQIATFPT